jgi:hypothetical protein
LFGDGAITRRRKKMTETLHHALRAILQFSVIFVFSGDTPSPNNSLYKFQSMTLIYGGFNQVRA